MSFLRKNLNRVLSFMCIFALVLSTFVFSFGASAATISSSENIFTELECITDSVTLSLTNTTEANNLANADVKNVLGLVSSSGSSHKIYSRTKTDADGVSKIIVKFASYNVAARSVCLGKDNVAKNGTTGAYILEPNTKYNISYYVFHEAGLGVSFDLIATTAINSTTGIVLDSYKPESVKKSWYKYDCTFTTPDSDTLGNNKYIVFAITNPDAVSNTVWLYDITVNKYSANDVNDVITFNDNGKIYYAHPGDLTELPEGDNGDLGSKFIGWVDNDGVAVTDIPAAGSIIYAKYPISSNIPNKVNSLTLDLTNTTEANNIAHKDGKGILGVVSSSNSEHAIYSRSIVTADGTTANIVKFASFAAFRTITFGKANVVANATDNAYIVKPNTKYSVSYRYYHEAGSGINLEIVAGSQLKNESYYSFDANTCDTADKTWKQYTCTFTTPDAETLGNHKYLQFAVNATISNVVWLYDVSIVEISDGTPSDYITLNDGDDVYYADPSLIDALPEGQNVFDDNEFLGWYDSDGKFVSELPEAGAELTAKYGVVKSGIVGVSIRTEKDTSTAYISAGIRFRGRISSEIADNATEIGFIAVPYGYSVDSSMAVVGKNKSVEDNVNIVYDEIYNGYVDYQIIITGLTRKGQKSNLLSMPIDVYFYYVVDGVTNYCGSNVTMSYDDVIAIMESDLPLVNNTIDAITTAPTGEAALDKLTGETLELTPPAFETSSGAATFADATDNTTLMTVTKTNKAEYEAYLANLDSLGYTAVVGNSRILSSSASYSAIYSDGTNLINIAYLDAEKTVKATIEPLNADTVEDINDYLAIFHDSSNEEPETAVCEPLMLTIGISVSEDNSDDGNGFGHGLGYIYRLADGSFVVIDGGHQGDAFDNDGKIYAMLKAYAPDPENIVISAWIMTHAHSDHINVFNDFEPKYLANEEYNVTLNAIIANLPNENWIADGAMTETSLSAFRNLFAQCEARGTKIYKAHVGQVYNLAGFAAEILYTMEQTAPTVVNKSMSNTSSVIFRVEFEDKSFLYTADATSVSITHINNVFGKKLKSDFVQVPHHGTLSNFASSTYPELQKFYEEFVKPEYLLWPSAEAGVNHYLTVASNPNAIYANSLPYENNISLGHNIDEISFKNGNVEVNTFDYYEIGYFKQEPVAITTESEFKAIGENLSGYYYLANDIAITEEVTTPYWGSTFAGYLDGNGYTVTFKNAINHSCSSNQSGILCTTIKGVIRNINFGSEEAPLEINYSASSSGAMGLFGSTRSNVTFDNVKIYSNITYTVNGGTGNYVGGFLGRVYCSSSNTAGIVVFKNCELIGTYTENASTSGNLKAFGGFIGGVTDLTRISVVDCDVNITAVGKCTTTNSGVGGIIGRLQHIYIAEIIDTTISGSISGRAYAGGLIGTVQPSTGKVVITDCTVNAEVSGEKGSGDMCGVEGTITVYNTNK